MEYTEVVSGICLLGIKRTSRSKIVTGLRPYRYGFVFVFTSGIFSSKKKKANKNIF